MRISLTSGEHLVKIKKSNPERKYFRPICLGEGEDLSLNFEERTGAVAGWGTTEVDYVYTQCGYKKGVTRPHSASEVLKKLLGLRWVTIDCNFLYFNISLPRFLSLEECFKTFDNIRTNACKSLPQIEKEGHIHICASSLAGDFCSGDSGSGLVILDKQIRQM